MNFQDQIKQQQSDDEQPLDLTSERRQRGKRVDENDLAGRGFEEGVEEEEAFWKFENFSYPPPSSIDFLPIDRHPLYNHVVLDLLFDFLDVPALKNCRQVCATWRQVGTRWILEKGVIEIDATHTSLLAGIKSWMESSGSLALFKNIRCDKITHASYPNILPLMGSHVLSFTVSSWWGDHRDLTLADYEDLLLERCPCLEELVLPSTKRFKNGLKFLQCAIAYDLPSPAENEKVEEATAPAAAAAAGSKPTENLVNLNLCVLKVTGDVRPHSNFWRLVIISPKLKYLYMQCHLVQEFWNPFAPRRTWEERMTALEKIEIRKYGNDSLAGHCARYFPGRPWTLKHFIYECYDLSDIVMQKGSEHLKETMESLEVVLFNKKYEPWPAALGQAWMTTPELKKLTKYKLSIDDHCEGPIFCRALVLSMLLPNLKSLTFTIFDEGENPANWEEGLFIRIYNDYFPPAPPSTSTKTVVTGPPAAAYLGHGHASSSSFTLTANRVVQIREGMEVLVLPPKMVDTSCIIPIITIYPNIKELTLAMPAPHFLSLILENWTNLERFTVTLPPEDGVNWNFVLTGLQASPWIGQNDNQYGVYFNGASIVNLKQLKSVDISLDLDVAGSPQILFLDDMLIYYGLVYLTQLQHVRIRGHRFTNDALQLLWTELVPFCHLDLND